MIKMILPFLSGICVLIFAVQWYYGIQVEAWVALIWAFNVFINDMHEYLNR